ncbi:MAG: hypothetical protein RL094_669 [Candidatus Parcubacteria bacterium]|jgi:deoxyribodipyrimidine photo-lyase
MSSTIPQKFDWRRARALSSAPIIPGPVVYWMSRDQRVEDNWALICAQEIAQAAQRPLYVCFYLAPQFLGATERQYDFMLKGLQEVEVDLKKKNIPFYVLIGDVDKVIPAFLKEREATVVIKDFSPLRVYKDWIKKVSKKIDAKTAFFEVDAHNIVPAWLASPKREFAAYTIRPKIKKLVPEFLTKFSRVKAMKPEVYPAPFVSSDVNWSDVMSALTIDTEVKAVDWIQPGKSKAAKQLKQFIEERFISYDVKRNDPTEKGQSDLSPYLHFGQLSAQRVVLEVLNAKAPTTAKESFLDEIIVRRELSDNFCLYTDEYDAYEGFPDWAKKTLELHAKDEREHTYTRKQFEYAQTHDDLWNAAQREMTKTGKMHGYMRMYWAKKILEWSKTPQDAMKTAIYLNDKYELDGRDPNGYAGIAWSIGGVHDRVWFNRPIFGTVRFMSYNGLKSKFNIKKYIETINSL